MLGVSVLWAAPGAFAVVWGARGARSWVSLTPESVVIRNALRTHTLPWSQVEGFEVFPASADGYATTQASLRLANGSRVSISCTALVFGWVWNGGKRWRTVSDFVQHLAGEQERILSGASQKPA
jgi:hypothetical protein